jgi:CubicO group peptidase (beta-lactamase class C family)
MSSGLEWREGEGLLNDETRLIWKNNPARYVLSHPMATSPGSAFNYNGGGTAILADLITRATGMPFKEFARRQLFEPLGIQDWEWVADLHGRAMPFNGLRLRPRDLAKIGRLVLNQGRWQGKQIVPEAWIKASLEPRFATGVSTFRYGYQWWEGSVAWQGKTLAWNAGFGNGGQRLFLVPDLDLVVVTTAGAYDKLPTARRVNQLIQEVVSTVK